MRLNGIMYLRCLAWYPVYSIHSMFMVTGYFNDNEHKGDGEKLSGVRI